MVGMPETEIDEDVDVEAKKLEEVSPSAESRIKKEGEG